MAWRVGDQRRSGGGDRPWGAARRRWRLGSCFGCANYAGTFDKSLRRAAARALPQRPQQPPGDAAGAVGDEQVLGGDGGPVGGAQDCEIGRPAGRERGWEEGLASVVALTLKKKNKK